MIMLWQVWLDLELVWLFFCARIRGSAHGNFVCEWSRNLLVKQFYFLYDSSILFFFLNLVGQ